MSTKAAVFLNLHVLLASVWRRRYVIVLPIFILPMLVLPIGVLTPKQYLSHTTVLIQETTKLNPFLSDFSVSTQLKERMAALEALLHSRHILVAVAQNLGWIDDEQDSRMGSVIGQLSSSLSVRLIGSDMINLSYRSTRPEEMADVLTAVSEQFLANLLAPERSSVNASETFLASQLELLETSLVTAELELAEYKSLNSAKLPNQFAFDVKLMRDAESDLRIKQTELAGARAKAESIKMQLLITNPLLATIEEKLLRQSSELNTLKTRYTSAHSKVVAAQRVMDRLVQERKQVMSTTVELSEGDLEQLWHLATVLSISDEQGATRPLLVSQLEAMESAKSTEQQLLRETEQLTQVIDGVRLKVEAFAGIEQQLNELERDIQTKQTLYNDFLKRFELAKVTGALGRYEEGDRVKVIDQPFIPQAPINPSIALYLVAGIIGGIFLGGGLALMFEMSETSITRRDTLEKLTRISVITRIPKLVVTLQRPVSPALLQTQPEVKR